jgi:hypothetical protein
VLPFLALSLATAPAHARQSVFAIDVAPTVLVPSSEYRKSVGFGFGALGGFELETIPSFSLTGRSGYILHVERNDHSRSIVPLLGGLKISSYSSSLYAAGEGGLAYVRDKYTSADSLGVDRKETRNAWGVSVGSAVDRHDLRFSVHVWDADRIRKSMTFSISIAFLIFGE